MEIRSIIDIGLSLGYTMETLQRVNRILDNLDKPKFFRRLSKCHFQTKRVPAGNAGTNLPSLLASKSSSHLRDLPTNPSGAPSVVGLARASREAEATAEAEAEAEAEATAIPMGLPERCIPQFAPSVVRTPRFLLSPVVTSRCTAAIASAE